MDARALAFPDATFDAVFSLSSIEHFGSVFDVRRAAREIGRVLRPGGHAFVVTECFIGWHPLDSRLVQTGIRLATLGRRCATATPWRRATEVFRSKELERWIVHPSGLELVQPLDLTLSAETWTNVARFRADGGIVPATGDAHPHVLLRAHGSAWTSVSLALTKRRS